jgi:hypothetical protein
MSHYTTTRRHRVRIGVTTDSVDTNKYNLQQDNDGYYYVPVGAFNCFNTSGEFYLKEGYMDFIDNPESSFNIDLRAGQLYAENGHPARDFGITDEDYLRRIVDISESNRIAHIRSIDYRLTDIDSGFPGMGNVYIVSAWVKPDGSDIGARLKADLDNPHINTAFSVRSLIKEQIIRGVKTRNVMLLVTFDSVNKPGIPYATKYKALGLEKAKKENPFLLLNENNGLEIEIPTIGLESGTRADYLLGIEKTDCSARLVDFFNRLDIDKKRNGVLKW